MGISSVTLWIGNGWRNCRWVETTETLFQQRRKATCSAVAPRLGTWAPILVSWWKPQLQPTSLRYLQVSSSQLLSGTRSRLGADCSKGRFAAGPVVSAIHFLLVFIRQENGIRCRNSFGGITLCRGRLSGHCKPGLLRTIASWALDIGDDIR